MYRCTSSSPTRARTCLAAVALLMALATPARGQLPRNFTADALRGRITVLQPPEVELNGHLQRLAPGSRIRNQNNMLEMSGGIVNQTFIVNYTIDTTGMVKDVWILTDQERAKRPWPTTQKQAQEWTFDFLNQTWSRP